MKHLKILEKTLLSSMKTYDKYKDSGIEWIGKIPEHWIVATVGRLSNLGRGRVISSIEIAENKGEYPVYSSQTEDYGIMGYLNSYDFEGEYVTWTTDGANAGTVFYRDGKFNCTNVCGTIQPKNWDQIDLRFLPYYLNLGTKFSVRLDINPKLMNNMMAKIPLIIPPKSEQTSIASYLDQKTSKIDELIADKKRLLELYQEEKTALINQAVTKGINPDVKMKDSGIEWLGEIPEHWEVKRFDFMFKFSRGLSITKADLINEGVPCVTYGEIHSKYPFELKPEIHPLKCVTSSYLETHQKSLIKKGDFVFADTSEDIVGSGNFTYLNSNMSVFAGYHTIIAIPQIKFKSRFVAYYFETLNFRNQIRSQVSGTKVYSITQAILKFTNIALPTIEEQKNIVNYIDEKLQVIDAKIAQTEKLIELYVEYRNALIREVVTGKIKVTD